MTIYVPRGPRTPRDVFEPFIWVKGGNRLNYDPPSTHYKMTYVLRGPRVPRDILKSFLWVKGGHRLTYDRLRPITRRHMSVGVLDPLGTYSNHSYGSKGVIG